MSRPAAPAHPHGTLRTWLNLEALEDRTVPSVTAIDPTVTLRTAVGMTVNGETHIRVYDQAGAQIADLNVTDLAGLGKPTFAVADVTGDKVQDIVVGSGAGVASQIRVYDGGTFQVAGTSTPFGGFPGGVNVAAADFTGDGVADIVASPDVGGGGRVVILQGAAGFSQVASFMGLDDPNFRGGLRVAAADVNRDGKADLVVGAGLGGGPRVVVYDGANVLTTRTKLVGDFFAFSPDVLGGVYVAGGDVNKDGYDDLIIGAGAGGAPRVLVLSGQVLTNGGAVAALAGPLASFFAGSLSSRLGVQVTAEDLNRDGFADILAGGFLGTGGTLTAYSGSNLINGVLTTLFDLTSALASGANLPGLTTTTTNPPPTTAGQALVTLQLKPLDIRLLGAEINSDPITVTVSAAPGSGALLGNALNLASNLVNLKGVSDALNNVLGGVVDLLNGASLSITQAVGSGGLTSSPTGIPAGTVTSVLDLYVAPVHLNLLGAVVDTSPIHLRVQARTGDGLILGNVLTALANLFNPPLPSQLTLDVLNAKLTDLLNQLDALIPVPPAVSPNPVITGGADRVLQLVVPPINLNLLGLNLQTDQIQVNADAHTGNGLLLGNVLTTLLNTLGATPDNLTTLSNNINALLAKVVGVLNASNLTLAPGAVSALAPVLQQLTASDLLSAPAGSSVPVLSLRIASPNPGTNPPVDVNLLGVEITTSNVNATLTATTGNGQILGNLVYNVSHLLDPGGSLGLVGILGALAL